MSAMASFHFAPLDGAGFLFQTVDESVGVTCSEKPTAIAENQTHVTVKVSDVDRVQCPNFVVSENTSHG